MAGFVLAEREDWYPTGTVVGAYLPVQRRPYLTPLPAAAPEGAAVESPTVTAGVLTFAVLAASTRYVLYALVGGQHRYMEITSNPT